MERYVFPRVGSRPVSEVNTADVLEILSPIWHVKAATAREVRQRIRAVLEWAIALDMRNDNPCDRVVPVLGPQNDIVTHRLALPHKDVAAAIETVRTSKSGQPAVKLAFEFLVLTAARSAEVRLATWDEMDTAGQPAPPTPQLRRSSAGRLGAAGSHRPRSAPRTRCVSRSPAPEQHLLVSDGHPSGARTGRHAVRGVRRREGDAMSALALGPLLRAFFVDHLLQQKAVSPQTVSAYRDAFRLLIAYMQQHRRREPEALTLDDLDAPVILAFLDHLEAKRANTVRSCNARLGAIRSFIRFAALRAPERVDLTSRVLAIPGKRAPRRLVN